MRSLQRLCLSLALLAGVAACDRDATDPTLQRGDVDALLASAGLTPTAGELTLRSLLHDAIRTVQRDQGTEAARLQLERLRPLSLGDVGLPPDSVRTAQLRIALQLLGPGVVGRTIAETEGRLRLLEGAVLALEDEPDGLEARLAGASAQLERARAAQAAGDALAALGAATTAAEAAATLRRSLIERDRVAALPEFFDRLEAQLAGLPAAERERALERHAELSAAAQSALAGEDRREVHRALAALRAEEVRLVVSVFGERLAERLLADVRAGLTQLEPQLGRDARLQRMHRAGHDLQVRAAAALEQGRVADAVDLGSHAASIVNALRLVVGLR